MPFGTDPYFRSGKYNVYLQWIQTTRQNLLNLNRYRPGNEQAIIDVEAMKNFLAIKTQTLINQAQSKYEKTVTDSKIAKDNKLNSDVTAYVEDYSTGEMKKQSDEIKKKQTQQATDNIKNRLDQQKKIETELSKRKDVLIVGDEGNPTPADQREESQIVGIPTYLDYDYIANGNSYTEPSFPKIGKDVTKAITDEVLRHGRFTYDVFSGGNPEYRGWVRGAGIQTQSTNGGALDQLKKLKPAQADKTKFFGTPEHPMSEYTKEVLKTANITAPTGTYKFFIEKLHGRYGDSAQTPFKLNPVTDQVEQYKGGPDGMNYQNRKVFAAFIDNYNDSYSAEWSSYNFLGRAEAVPVYKATSRRITMEFTVLTDHSVQQLAALDQLNQDIKGATDDELLEFLLNNDVIHWGKGTYVNDAKSRILGNGVTTYYDTPETTWQKLTFLAQCVYPYYRTDGKMKEQPMIRMRIADFYDVICYINNLSIRLDPFDVPYIDFNNSYLGEQPMGFKVTLDATIIHDYEPSSEFYGFYHRKQFDQAGEDGYKARVWGLGLSKNADTLTKLLKKNSPLSIKDVYNMKNPQDLLKTTDFQEIQENVRIFKENFKGLSDKTGNLFEQVRKIKLKNIFDAIKNIKENKEFFDALKAVGSKFTETVGAGASIAQGAKNKVTQVNQNLKAAGIDLDNAAIVQEVNKAVDKTNPAKFIPKTMGDIIEKVGAGSNIVR
jgi:hypothetical protein